MKRIVFLLSIFVSFGFCDFQPAFFSYLGVCPKVYTYTTIDYPRQNASFYITDYKCDSSSTVVFYVNDDQPSTVYCSGLFIAFFYSYNPRFSADSFVANEWHFTFIEQKQLGSSLANYYELKKYYVHYGRFSPFSDPELDHHYSSEWDSSTNSCICKEGFIAGDDNSSCVPKSPELLEQPDGKEGECGVSVGSYIVPKYRIFNDNFEIKGTSISINYSSARVEGYKSPLYPFNSTNIVANGWTLSNVHYFNNKTNTLHLGDGEVVEYSIYDITTLNNGNIIVYDKSHIGHEFNRQGLILRSFDNKSNNNIYTFTYNNNNLAKITDILGRSIVINRDSLTNKIVSIIAPHSQITSLQIDSNNNLVSISYEDSSAFRFEYNINSLLTKKTTPRDYVYSYKYDNNGRVSKSINPLGNEYTFNSSIYNNLTAISSFTTPSGSSYSYTNAKTNNNGVQFSSSVNPFGDVRKTTTTNNELNRHIDSCGILTTVTYDIDELSMQKRVSSINRTMPSGLNSYEIFHSSYTSRPNNTQKETSTHTLNGKTTTTITDYHLGTHLTTSPEGRSTDVRFDKDSLLITSVLIPSISTTTFTYNAKKELAKVAFGTRVYDFTYDTRGNILTYKDALGTYTYSYDNMDRVTSITDPNNYRIYFYYDNEGNMIRITNPTSHYNEFTYNALNNKNIWSSPLGYQTRYTYNEDKNIASIQRPSGKSITNSYINSRLYQTTTPQTTYNYLYNCGSLISKISSSDNEEVNYSYDGELLKSVSYGGLLNEDISYTYNNDFLPASITYAKETHRYSYDKDSLVTKIDNLNITRNANVGAITKVADTLFTKTITYNSFNEEEKVNDVVNKKSVFNKNITSLNNNGQILKATEQTHNKTINYTYVYDKLGRLTKSTQQHTTIASYTPTSSVVVTNNTINSVEATADVVNDNTAPKQLSTIKKGASDLNSNIANCDVTTSTNSKNKISKRSSTKKSISTAADLNSNIANCDVTTSTNSNNNNILTNTASKRLSTKKSIATINNAKTNTTTNTASNKTNTTNNNNVATNTTTNQTSSTTYEYIEEFTYDSKGNILTKKITKDKNTILLSGTYSIEDSIEKFGEYTYIYDNDGYLIQKLSNSNISDRTEYIYGTLGELREVKLPNKSITYRYNALNQKVAKLINNEIVEKYLWLDLITLLAIYDKDDNLIQRYYYYPNSRVPYKLKDSSNNIYYLSYNHQQSLRAITDINGNVVKDIEYSVYGEILNDTNSSISVPFSFAGGVIDSDTKLIRFGYRYYDTYSSKWTSKDPIDFNGKDINLYNYVLNDPVNLIDPIGLSPLKWFGKAKGAKSAIEGVGEVNNAFEKRDECNKWRDLANNKSLPYYEKQGYELAYANCYNTQVRGPDGAMNDASTGIRGIIEGALRIFRPFGR